MKKNKGIFRKYLLQTLLLAVILLLSSAVFLTIYRPVQARNEISKRRNDVIARLTDIRKAQLHYKAVYGQYAPDFTALISFIKNGEIPVIRLVHDPADTSFTRSISDTIRIVAAGDSLFPGQAAELADSLRFIPHSGGVEFEMQAGQIERKGMTLNVFEVSAANKDFLGDISTRYYDVYGGLTLGSMMEPLTNGNWE